MVFRLCTHSTSVPVVYLPLSQAPNSYRLQRITGAWWNNNWRNEEMLMMRNALLLQFGLTLAVVVLLGDAIPAEVTILPLFYLTLPFLSWPYLPPFFSIQSLSCRSLSCLVPPFLFSSLSFSMYLFCTNRCLHIGPIGSFAMCPTILQAAGWRALWMKVLTHAKR
jgi:hypothetical protein